MRNNYCVNEIVAGKQTIMHGLILFFIAVGIRLFYLCIAVYLYGDLAIYATAVPKSMRNIVW